MKNLRCVVERQDISDFILSQWKTDIFRISHRTGGFINDIVNEFSWVPRFFAETTNDTLERAHFSTWWGVIMLRDDYTNPYIHDLYLLHEMYHAARMPYIVDIGQTAFDEKMQRNELEASVLSEIVVYFEMPGLRELSFDHPIYADRFLTGHMQALWAANKTVAIETLRSMRRDVMVSKPVHLMDVTEIWIRRFSEQNSVWNSIWGDTHRVVENTMHDFQMNAIRSNRRGASDAHMAWLERAASFDKVDNIPFRAEAELFAPFYWANKEKYAKAMM